VGLGHARRRACGNHERGTGQPAIRKLQTSLVKPPPPTVNRHRPSRPQRRITINPPHPPPDTRPVSRALQEVR
jgi:hypothetical protein